MSKFRRQHLVQSVQRKRRAKLARSVQPCVIEGLEDRQLLSLTIDLRVADGTKAANVTSVGQTVNLQLWAVVTGTGAETSLDGFQEVIGSIISNHTAPGSVHGNLAATVISPFDDTASQNGTSQDLNADGDLDVGSDDTTTSDNYFFARSGGMDFAPTVPATADSQSFEIATLTYTVTSLTYGQATDINFVAKTIPSYLPAAVWREDNVPENNQSGTLQSGTAVVVTSNAAPAVPTGSISGTVFNDTNDDGKQDNGETGVAGAVVYIDANNNGVLDAGEEETTTNSSGQYTLTELPAGSYTVRQVVPSGEVQTTPAAGSADTVTLSTGQQATGSNFADSSTGLISGTIFNDANGNGVRDTGENGIQGVTVYIDANNDGKLDDSEKSTTTDVNGVYGFFGLSAGTYVIREVVPTGDTQTLPANGAANTVVLSTAQSYTNADFADKVTTVASTASITGTVFNDANGNGTLDSGELGISGVSVYIDTTNTGVFKTGDLETTTNASGVYSFTGLAAGAYIVRQILPTDDTQDFPTSNFGNHVTLAAAQAATGINFGDKVPAVTPPTTGSITGTVFDDVNGNGVQDSGEAGISGETVYIDANNNGIDDSGEVHTTTNASGVYTFTGLAAGTYLIRQVDGLNDLQTTPADLAGISVTLATSQAATGINFGDEVITPPPFEGSISGTVFDDINGNGVQDSGDLGIAGVTVYNDPTNAGVFKTGDVETTTNASGVYTFTDLPVGNYIIRQILPTGDIQDFPANGFGNHVTLVAVSTPVTGQIFADQVPVVKSAGASITGTVFNDANGNGTLDSGELGISGVSVYIDITSAAVFKTGDPETTTNASGVYSFTGLAAGTYIVRQILSGSVTQDFPTNGFGNHVTLAANQAATGINFGDHASTVSMAGTVFADTNGNGKQDSGELGIAGVTVQLEFNNSGTLQLVATGTTNASGGYTFIGLPPDTYVIHQVVPSGDTQDFPAANADNSVTLTSGQAATGLNFGDQVPVVIPPTGSISGTVFNDANDNGVQDSGELGISGVSVYIDINDKGGFVSGDPEVTTNASGAYTFTGLTAGTYIIRQIVPGDDEQTFPTELGANTAVLATNSSAAANVNFGDESQIVTPPNTGSISGFVALEASEVDLAGVTVYNDANNNGKLDPGELSTTTNASGAYTFSNLPAGTYLIRQILPSGDTQISPSNSFGQHVTLAANESAESVNFGDATSTVTPPTGGSITGTVFNDANGNGNIDSGELGISGVSVYIDATNAGVFKTGDLETTTNASGVYTFTGLTAGTYIVRQVFPIGETQDFPTNGFGNHVTLSANQAATSINFGDQSSVVVVKPPAGASITGTVFNDANGNGKQDSGELGISGVSVYIDTTNAGVFKSGDPETTTNASGVYSFGGLSAGAYIVRQMLPGGDKQTLPSGGLGNHITLTANEAATGENFGDQGAATQQFASISGTVFNDTNGNGTLDSGEVGIANVFVYVDTNDVGSFQAGDMEMETTSTGQYNFINLLPGTYIIRQIVPSGFTADSLADSVTVSAGEASTGNNIGDQA